MARDTETPAEVPDGRFHFREAWEALQRLRADPDDTDEVFVIIRAMAGNSGERAFQRFIATEHGLRILREERDLLATLHDRAYLESLPAGTLGREYAAFTEREANSADGLVEASHAVPRDPVDADRRRLFDRLRDCHDLHHVATGFGRDLVGEAGILTFDTAQQWHHGIALIIAQAYAVGGPAMRAAMRDAWRRGRSAGWLAGADWERLLEMPLAEVRRELGIGPLPQYEPEWSAGAPPPPSECAGRSHHDVIVRVELRQEAREVVHLHPAVDDHVAAERRRKCEARDHTAQPPRE